MKSQVLLIPITLALLLIGCSDRNVESKSENPTKSSSVEQVIATDHWAGKWNGPEGTFLKIVGDEGVYEITIQNLDGARNFSGHAVGGDIQFDRNGVQESLHATTGRETGMKWLIDKSECLTVRVGEGYCRN